MNWRAIILWVALSVIAWFILVAVMGLVAAWVIQQRYGLADIPLGQAGVLTPVMISIGLLPRLAAGFLLAPVFWALLAKRFPGIELGRKKFVGFLAAVAIAAGLLMSWALPLNLPFALLAGFLFALSFASPRFLSRSLSSGTFAAHR